MAFSVEQIEAAIEASMKVTDVERLKENQMKAIVAFVRGRDVFVCLPTGYLWCTTTCVK